MSERGVFAVDRGIWDHPSFEDEPFTQREAWAWLISEAAFKPRTKRIGSVVVELQRGQAAAAVRFMASKWKWHPSKVQRFLDRLKTDAMIGTDATHGITVITVCNYAKYQKVSLPPNTQTDTPTATPPIQQRYKEESTKSTEVVNADAASRESLVSPEALVLTEKLLVIAGHSTSFWPPGWCGAPMRVQTWLSQGWRPEIIVAAVTSAASRKTGPPANRLEYFENAVAEEVARQSKPLPIVQISEAQTLQVNHAPNRGRSGNVVDAFARLEEQMRARDRDEASADAIRFLPGR